MQDSAIPNNTLAFQYSGRICPQMDVKPVGQTGPADSVLLHHVAGQHLHIEGSHPMLLLELSAAVAASL